MPPANNFISPAATATAWLPTFMSRLAPDDERLPAMLALHQTAAIGKGDPAGVESAKGRPYAAELAVRGYVVLAPDYPSFGDSKDYDFQHDRYESGTMKGIFNHMRAVDLLVARDDVDPDRIARSAIRWAGITPCSSAFSTSG